MSSGDAGGDDASPNREASERCGEGGGSTDVADDAAPPPRGPPPPPPPPIGHRLWGDVYSISYQPLTAEDAAKADACAGEAEGALAAGASALAASSAVSG